MDQIDNENLDLSEASESKPKGNDSIKQKIKSRVNLVKNRLRLPVNASIASNGLTDYVNMSMKNPKLSHYGILQKLPGQKRDAVSKINSAIPIPMIVNAPDNQLRRALRDILREQKMALNESSFNPPAMILLKRQAIRLFPDGKRVALYADNKYGLVFPIPYDASGAGFNALNTVSQGPITAAKTAMPGYVNEEVVDDKVIILFATGDELIVEQEVMDKINHVYNSLNEENRQRMSDMILESEESFNKVKEFALSFE